MGNDYCYADRVCQRDNARSKGHEQKRLIFLHLSIASGGKTRY